MILTKRGSQLHALPERFESIYIDDDDYTLDEDDISDEENQDPVTKIHQHLTL